MRVFATRGYGGGGPGDGLRSLARRERQAPVMKCYSPTHAADLVVADPHPASRARRRVRRYAIATPVRT